MTASVRALNLRIKFRYLLFKSVGFYNEEKMKPDLFYNKRSYRCIQQMAKNCAKA